MGGKNETFLDVEKPAQAEPEQPDDGSSVMGSIARTGGGRLRTHESGGEVHFHDDNAKLKVAVPVAKWAKAWDRLSTEMQQIIIPDPKHKTALTVETTLENGVLDFSASISPITIGTNFSEMSKFTTRR